MPRNVQKYFIQKRSSKQNSQQKLDKAPLLSISNDIWILHICQLNQLFSNSEAVMLFTMNVSWLPLVEQYHNKMKFDI